MKGMDKLAAILQGARELRPPVALQPPVPAHVWERAVGSRIARRAQPHRLDRGILWVRVASAVWANELSLLGDDILGQLRAHGVAADSLRFTVGALDVVEPPRRTPKRAAPTDRGLPAAVQEKVSGVEDDELRSALHAAASRSLHMPEE
jgi:hypothetical protein